MQLSDFQPKTVQGLYYFDHFEHASGAFVQRYHGLPTYWIVALPTGERETFTTADALRSYLANVKG